MNEPPNEKEREGKEEIEPPIVSEWRRLSKEGADLTLTKEEIETRQLCRRHMPDSLKGDAFQEATDALIANFNTRAEIYNADVRKYQFDKGSMQSGWQFSSLELQPIIAVEVARNTADKTLEHDAAPEERR